MILLEKDCNVSHFVYIIHARGDADYPQLSHAQLPYNLRRTEVSEWMLVPVPTLTTKIERAFFSFTLIA